MRHRIRVPWWVLFVALILARPVGWVVGGLVPHVSIRHTSGLERLLRVVGPAYVSAVSFISFEQKTIDATAGGVSFTAAKIQPNGSGTNPQATLAVCRQEAAEVRFTIDGTAPTTTVGTLLEIGDWLSINGFDSLLRFRAIRTGATSGQADCTYTAP